MYDTSKRLPMPLLDNYSEVKNHGRVGQNCRLYNHYGSIFIHFGFQDSLTYMYYISKCLYMSLLYKYIQ